MTVSWTALLKGWVSTLFAPTALGVAASLADPARKGRALSMVTAGLAAATALGAPIGTFIGGLGDWRTTLWFVAALGLVSMIGVWAVLSAIPQPPRITLRERFSPVRDLRIALILLTSLFAFGGFLMVYTYAGPPLHRATGGDARVLAGLLLVWGVAATAGNMMAGHLVDRFGSRKIINAGLFVAIVNFCVFPWTSAHIASALVSLIIWGVIGWGLIVPQQHRLVKIAPQVAPLLLALNNTATYTGLASSGLLGGVVLLFVDARYLSLVGAGLIGISLLLATLASDRVRSPAINAGTQQNA